MKKLLFAACAALSIGAVPLPALAQVVTGFTAQVGGVPKAVTDSSTNPHPVTCISGCSGSSLSAKANAASQASSEGVTTDPLSMDLHRSLRVLNMDSSGNVIDPNAALPAGANIIGKVTTDQTTHGTTDLVAADNTKINGVAISTGNGVVGTGVQRVAIASDNTAFAVNAAVTAASGSFGSGSIADGAEVTLGTKADAATCATTNTAMACFRQLDADIKAAVPAGTNIIGKVTTDQTTHGTTDLVADDLTKVGGATLLVNTGATGAGSPRVTVAVDAATVAGSASLPAGTNIVGYDTTPFDVATTITRPANVTAYTALDVLGGALDLGVLAPSGKAVDITTVQLEADIAAIPAGQTSWILYLYNVTPPSAVADNGTFDLPSGDRASFLGSIAIPTLVDLGSTLYVETTLATPKQVLPSGTHLFAYLVTVGGFTPNANSEVYKLTVHTRTR